MNPTPELIRAAQPRDEWVRIAMAIKSELPDESGFDLFDHWSQSDADGYDAKAVRATWRSVHASGGVNIGTLLRQAQQNGFRLPDADGRELVPAKDAQFPFDCVQRWSTTTAALEEIASQHCDRLLILDEL